MLRKRGEGGTGSKHGWDVATAASGRVWPKKRRGPLLSEGTEPEELAGRDKHNDKKAKEKVAHWQAGGWAEDSRCGRISVNTSRGPQIWR